MGVGIASRAVLSRQRRWAGCLRAAGPLAVPGALETSRVGIGGKRLMTAADNRWSDGIQPAGRKMGPPPAALRVACPARESQCAVSRVAGQWKLHVTARVASQSVDERRGEEVEGAVDLSEAGGAVEVSVKHSRREVSPHGHAGFLELHGEQVAGGP